MLFVPFSTLFSFQQQHQKEHSFLVFSFLFYSIQSVPKLALNSLISPPFLPLLLLVCSPLGLLLSAQRPKCLPRRGRGATTFSRLPTAYIMASAGSQEQGRSRGEERESEHKTEEKKEKVGKERQHHCKALRGCTN